jgi:predicted small secreted protein
MRTLKLLLAIILLWVAFVAYACNKDSPQGYGQDNGCNCGTIVDDDVDSATQCYWLLIENDCSGNQKRFCVDPLVWSAYPVGDRICINNINNW